MADNISEGESRPAGNKTPGAVRAVAAAGAIAAGAKGMPPPSLAEQSQSPQGVVREISTPTKPLDAFVDSFKQGVAEAAAEGAGLNTPTPSRPQPRSSGWIP